MKKLLMILLLALLTINVSCGGGGSGSSSAGTSLVTITVGEGMQSVSLKVEKNTLFAEARLFLKKLMPDAAFAAIPSEVYKIVFTISGPGMSTMTKEVLVAGQTSITETFSVPNGNDRNFFVRAEDISGNALYHGDATNVDLDGTSITLSIEMRPEEPPTVISTSPINNETGVAVTSAIIITFSESIDPSTFNPDTFSLRNNGSNVEGEISFNGAVVTFTPSANLAYSTTYTATITIGVKDLAGNAMTENYTWTFTTGAEPDTTPPTVTAVSPGIGATNVPITTTVTATFSEAMDASTINTTTFTLVNGGSPISGTVAYAGTTATFTPSGNLNYSTAYTATVTTGVKDLAGNAMTSDYSWTFTTGTALGTGNISGSVKDASTQNPLQGVSISVYNQGSVISTGTSDSSGTYNLSVPEGSEYWIEFSKADYITVNYYNVSVVSNTTTYLETVFMVGTAGTGNVSGRVVNALDGNGVDGLTINLRAGTNITTGTIVAATTTQNAGFYAFTELNAGTYTAEASGEGYNTTYFTIVCIGGTTTPNQDATITPILSSGETRIVLTWGETPSDLDSHLTGPMPEGGRFHVYYSDQEYYYNDILYVGLDLDDTTSYGPETTTIYQQISGVYRFSVHDYTNRSAGISYASYDLSNSGAQVRVYRGSNLVATFNVPANQEGTLWTVFELNGDVITPVNAMSYESIPGNIQRISSKKSFKTDASLIRNLLKKK
ncbi:MAG: Ig-like domain-containing protein [Nitrospirota bacterium]